MFFLTLYTASGTGNLQIDLVSFFPVYATSRDCMPNTSTACNPYLVVLQDGKEIVKWVEMHNTGNSHTNYINTDHDIPDIPNNARVTIQLWNKLNNGGASELMNEWTIPPSDFNTGDKLLIGQEYARKIQGKDQRTELFLHFTWTPVKNFGMRLIVN